MALHRDVYWVGRQWAVTGYGIQACDQKQKGKFDIEAARLWDDGLVEDMRTLGWLNVEDFSQALSIARARYPEPGKVAPPGEDVSHLNVPSSQGAGLKESPVEPPKPAAQPFDMRIERWPAKFVRQWRIRVRIGGG